jgi:hypothetical protein
MRDIERLLARAEPDSGEAGSRSRSFVMVQNGSGIPWTKSMSRFDALYTMKQEVVNKYLAGPNGQKARLGAVFLGSTRGFTESMR